MPERRSRGGANGSRRRLLPEPRLYPLLAALMAGLLLSELDQSMVAAALPTIVDELISVQGTPVDIGGYYKVDEAKTDAVMRP